MAELKLHPVEIGMTATFDPFLDVCGYAVAECRHMTRGTVVYVNDAHHWFSVVYGQGQRTSFNFDEIGNGKNKKVMVSWRKK